MSLIGILIIIVGFALKLDTIAVVVSAGVVTGLVADMSISEILSTLGTAFINNRTTCLFMLTLHHLNDFLIFFIYFFRSSTYIFYRFHKDTDRYGRSSYPLRWW